MSDAHQTQEDAESFMTQLEIGLKDDPQGTFRDAIRQGINEHKAQVEAALRRGAPPDEYNRLNALKRGFDSANVILDRFWTYYNQ